MTHENIQPPFSDESAELLRQIANTMSPGQSVDREPSAIMAHPPNENSEPANQTPANQIELPNNVHWLLDHALEESGMLGTDTRKYTIAGHPGLFVRHNIGYRVEERQRAMDAFCQINVNIPPFRIVERGDEHYVITNLVTGQPLTEALAENPSEELLQATDNHMQAVVQGLINARRYNRPWPIDIEGHHQVMVGTIPGQPEPRLWLVDFPGKTNNLDDGDTYETEIFYVLGALLEAEKKAGRQMPAARQTFYDALELCRDTDEYGDGLPHAARYALENNTLIMPYEDEEYDEIIQSLRTR